MNSLESKKQSYYYQCVMESNREANFPFTLAEIGDYVKVRVTVDRNGQFLIKGMAYKIININEVVLTLQPLSFNEQYEFMQPHHLEELQDVDFIGVRYLHRDNALLIKRVNIDTYMDFLRIQKQAYGVVNQDALWGNKNCFVTSEVDL